MRTILMISLISLAAATPAAAQQAQTQLAAAETNAAAAADVSDAKPAAPAVQEKKVCKRLPSSYSKRTDRVCLTEREWAQVEQDSQS